MEKNKAFKFVSDSARVQTPSTLSRMIAAIQDFFSIAPAAQRQLIPVRSVYQNESGHSARQRALMNMLNHGKHYDHADLILNETEEWELDYDLLNPSRIALRGNTAQLDARD